MTDHRHEPELSHLRGAAVPHGLADRLAAKLPAVVDPVRPLPPVVLRALAVFGLLAVAAIGLGFGAGGKGWRALEASQRFSLTALVIAGAALFAWELGARMSPAPRLHWATALPLCAVAAAMLGWVMAGTPLAGSAPLFYFACLAFTTLATLVSALLAWLWLRRGFAPSQSGLALASAAALGGFAAVEFFCPYMEAAHIVTSHFPAMLAGGLIASFALARSHSRS